MRLSGNVDRAAHGEERMHHPGVLPNADYVAGFAQCFRVLDTVVTQRIALPHDDECGRKPRQLRADERRVAKVRSVGFAFPIMFMEPEDRLSRQQIPVGKCMV